MRRVYAFLMALWCVSGMSLAKGKDPKLEINGVESLAERAGRFEMTLVQPDADFSRYQKMLVRHVEFEFRKTESNGPNSSTGRILGSREMNRTKPSRKEIKKYEEIIRSSLVSEVTTCGDFQMVDEPGPGTLILQPKVEDMVSVLSNVDSHQAGAEVEVLAEGMIVIDFVDAETGVIQARIGDRRRALHFYNSAEDGDEVDVWVDIGDWAQRAVADLLTELKNVLDQDVVDESPGDPAASTTNPA